MLSASSSQYLQPDYIQPLPSSLDVNSSPLALLAQTCSSIGKDTTGPPPSKAGAGGGGGGGTGSDKKAPPQPSHSAASGAKDSTGGGGARSKSESPPIGRNASLCSEERSKSRTSGNEKKDSGHHGQVRSAGKVSTPKPGFRVPPTPSKESSAGSLRGGGGDRVNIDSGDSGGRSSREGLLLQPLVPSTVGRPVGHGTLMGSAVSSAKSTGSSCSSMLLELNQEALSKSSSLHGGPLHPLYGSLKDGLQALHGSLGPSSLGALPFLGYPLSLDPLATAAAAYSASLAAHCSGLAAAAAAAGLGLSAQKSPSTPSAVSGIVSSTPCSAAVAALPPYVSYVRMKTAAGGTTLVPVCKDPYCAHCQVALHGAAQLAVGGGGSACTGPGCGQCTAHHGKSSPTSLASPTLAGLPFFPPPPPPGASASALCSHAAFSSPVALQGTSPHGGPLVTPYVCNWVQGSDGYCGKRFSSSDDLLQHLRSHTSTAAASDSSLVSPFHHVGLPLSSIGFPFGGLLGCPTLSPGGALLGAPSSYPRSLSPNSLLSAARYHPYKPPSLSVLPCTTPPGLSGAFPSLAAYYSPYAFYGQRGVGTAAAVGP